MIGLLLLAHATWSPAPPVEYSARDSVEVVSLLRDESLVRPIDYARRFLGRPYLAATLDGYYDRPDATADNEHLVVRLDGFDCLTLLETCGALSMSRGGTWDDFTHALTTLRYRGGHLDGYLSRLHYLTMSIDDLTARGILAEVRLPERLTRERTVSINFMSRHAASYPALKRSDAVTRSMAEQEAAHSPRTFRFLPQENCGLRRSSTRAGDGSANDLSAIHDGDLLYIVTDKDGLDYSHQGYAYWAPDGRLHMLHASSANTVGRKVIADSRPLADYLKGISASIGVRVFRMSEQR